jgi:hypothetical protein
MSLLHQGTTDELDEAARGEEFTKGTSHLIITSLIAGVAVTIAMGLYVGLNQTPTKSTGEIVAVWAHPLHVETSGLDANGAPMAKEVFDQVLVFTEVRLHNQSKGPLFLTNMMTNATLADGIHSSYAATATDYDRMFLAYPGLTVPHGKALQLQTTIEAGQTVEGTVVSAFRLTKQQWDARKDLNYTFSFHYQPNLSIAPHIPVNDQ